MMPSFVKINHTLPRGRFLATNDEPAPDDPSGGSRGPLDDFWYRPIGASTQSGVAITPDLAMEVSAVFACIKVLGETLGIMPLLVYQRTSATTKKRAIGDPIYDLLHKKPNVRQTPFDFKETMTAWAALHGNAYALKTFDPYTGVVTSLNPVHPTLVRLELLGDGSLRYWIRQAESGLEVAYLASEMFHLHGLSLDGFSGAQMTRFAREAIGLTRAMESFGARFFKNDMTVGTIYEHPGQLSDTAFAHLKESLNQGWSGASQHRPMVLEEGLKLNRLQNNGKDAQLTDQRLQQIPEVCRFFRMPPHKIAHLMQATFSNIEHQAIEFVTDTIQPWAVRWEQAISRDLLLNEDDYFAEYLMAALLRGDTAGRAAYYKERFYIGTLSRNEVRAMENDEPIEGGDTYYVNSATVPLDSEGNPRPMERITETATGKPLVDAPPADEPDDSENEDTEEDVGTAAAKESFTILLTDAADRIASMEYKEVAIHAKHSTKDRGQFIAWIGTFWTSTYEPYMLKTLRPLTKAWRKIGGLVADTDEVVSRIAGARSASLCKEGADLHARHPTQCASEILALLSAEYTFPSRKRK